MIESFEEWDDKKINLPEKLLRGIYSYGFEKPSLIQQKTLLPMQSSKDIIAQAQSGTGKTGAFLIGTLQKINTDIDKTQVIILSPTRELANQIYCVCNELGKYMGLNTKLIIGGTSVTDDIVSLQVPPHIIIGCTGRIYDMLKRRHIDSTFIKTLVLDEADEMLSQGFKTQVYSIFRELDQDIQVVLFSATMPPELTRLTDKFMRDPIKVLVETSQLSLEGITQYKIEIGKDEYKLDVLKDIFANISICQTIIYCNNINRVCELYDNLKKANFSVQYIHSNMNNEERKQNFESFVNGQYRVLISSDITSRGIDIHQVSIVINFDFPSNKHNYLHRIGRSGRWGRKGLAINFITPKNHYNLKHIEEWYKIKIDDMPMDFTTAL